MTNEISKTPPAEGTRANVVRPKRWENPFDPEISESDIEKILDLPLFRKIDRTGFPATGSLRDIVANDTRILNYRRGDIIVRQGYYGNSVFIVIKGTIRRVAGPEGERVLAPRRVARRLSWFRALAQIWWRPKYPEVRYTGAERRRRQVQLRSVDGADARAVIDDVDGFLEHYATTSLTAGSVFGAVSALSRSPRMATAFADTDTQLIEMRWQGLRDIRRRDRWFHGYIDGLYRLHGLRRQLEASPLFRHLDGETLDVIAEHTQFETYGDFEWTHTYKGAVARDSSTVIESEPVIAEEGQDADSLIMISSGFVRVSQRRDHGQRTIGYMTMGEFFGLDEVYGNWRNGEDQRLRFSLRAVGYVDVLRVPIGVLKTHVFPTLSPQRVNQQTGWVKDGGAALRIRQSVTDFLVDNRAINGTATMLINLDRCVGCDDCVKACALAHGDNPRFVRHGPDHGPLMIANACMHCADPVCMIGCPTGAISRNSDDGRVLIDDPACVGCATCANSCPYNNIRMVQIRNHEGATVIDEATGSPVLKATKCDLCLGQLGGPACQRACPHDALVRIDMKDRQNLAAWINR